MKGWRTIIWTAANAIVLGMGQVSGAYAIPQEWLPWWIMILLIGNVVLRLVTTTPVGESR